MSCTLAPALVMTWEGEDWISRASVPCTAKSQITMPLRGSSHQASNSSRDSPLCSMEGVASTTQGPLSSRRPPPRTSVTKRSLKGLSDVCAARLTLM